MTEYLTVKRIDNSRLVRPMAPARVKDYWRRVGVGCAMAACLLFYAWQHFECIQLRYKVAQLQSERAEAAELNLRLHSAVAQLESPGRVNTIAERDLGLDVRAPGEPADFSGAPEPVVAQVRTVAISQRQ